ncbi:MAG: GTPase RsgA, partial [Pseudomonadales bacterium]
MAGLGLAAGERQAMNLGELGWDGFFAAQLDKGLDKDGEIIPARVRRQDVNQFHLLAETGEFIGQLPGRLRDAAESKASLPVVGDWVLVKPIAQGAANQVVIERLLTRKSSFSRKESGAAMAEQVLAANIDTAFIVSGLDGDFNPNRIERYLLLSWDSGAQPVIILNKTDLCPDANARAQELAPTAMDTPILLISALAGTGLEQLQGFMGPGKTSAFI